MKTRTLLITIVLLTAVMGVIAGGSTKKLSTEEAYEIIAGTWFNEEYMLSGYEATMIQYQDGTWAAYPTDDLKVIPSTGETTVHDIMIDPNGNIWLKVTIKWESNQFESTLYGFYKISDSEMTLEIAASEKEDWYSKGYPSMIGPDDMRYNYTIRYRQ